MKTFLSAAMIAAGFSGAALAHHDGAQYKAGAVAVSHVYTFENAQNAHSMRVYLTIMNEGETADMLVNASVPFADTVHFGAQTLNAAGSLVTNDVQSLTVEPGQTLTLQPGAVWIELEGVSQTFEHGQHFDMELTFQNAGALSVEVEVEEAEAHDHDRDDEHDHVEGAS